MSPEISLPRQEFDILADDADRIVIYDKVVDKLYEYNKPEKKWKFPAGSRIEYVNIITGLDLQQPGE